MIDEQSHPKNTFCALLKRQSKSDQDFHLRKWILVREIAHDNLLFSIPVISCLFLLERGEDSWIKTIRMSIRKWWPIILTYLSCSVLNSLYLIAMFFYYQYPASKDYPIEYPTWIKPVSHVIWVIELFVIIHKASEIYAAKYTTFFVIQHGFSQYIAQQQYKKIYKSLQRRLVLSILLPSLVGLLLKQLLLRAVSISSDYDRYIIIFLTLGLGVPLWLWMDSEGRKSLPWTEEAKQVLYVSKRQNSGTACHEHVDEVERNGFVLSSMTIVGVSLIVRFLQANMESLGKKIVSVIITSVIESVIVIFEPVLRKIFRSFMVWLELFRSNWGSKKTHPSRNIHANYSTKNYHENAVFGWHRAHIIIFVNRLEIFSIILGCVLVIISANMVTESIEVFEGVENSQECVDRSIPKTGSIIVAGLVMCLMETLVEFFTYVYIIRVEHLPFEFIMKQKRMIIAFIYYSIITMLYTTTHLFTSSLVMFSCNGLDENIYKLHCVV